MHEIPPEYPLEYFNTKNIKINKNLHLIKIWEDDASEKEIGMERV